MVVIHSQRFIWSKEFTVVCDKFLEFVRQSGQAIDLWEKPRCFSRNNDLESGTVVGSATELPWSYARRTASGNIIHPGYVGFANAVDSLWTKLRICAYHTETPT